MEFILRAGCLRSRRDVQLIKVDERTESLTKRAVFGVVKLLAVLGILLFVPAGSLDLWQAWIFAIVFSASTLLITFYFLKRDPGLIQRRLKGGPAAEKERSQKIIQALASIFFIAEIVVPGLDHRFHWSDVSPVIVILADLFVALGFVVIFLTFRENSFASATIEVSQCQKIISTGPYRILRHPMYAGALLMQVFTPLALGSYWGLLVVPLMFVAIISRMLNEEKFLVGHLQGYDEYRHRVRYRLVPFVW
jgi:protein-S-isoprenylcysteine O-methyltransferase Ste14